MILRLNFVFFLKFVTFNECGGTSQSTCQSYLAENYSTSSLTIKDNIALPTQLTTIKGFNYFNISSSGLQILSGYIPILYIISTSSLGKCCATSMPLGADYYVQYNSSNEFKMINIAPLNFSGQ